MSNIFCMFALQNLKITQMAILLKDIVTIEDDGGKVGFRHIQARMLESLEPGDYAVYICNKKKNKTLSQLKYLFGVVLRGIADYVGGDRYSVNDLYRFFEKQFAPTKAIELNGVEHITQDLKHCTSKEMGDVIEDIMDWSSRELGVSFPDRKELSEPQNQEEYVKAYNDEWGDYNLKV